MKIFTAYNKDGHESDEDPEFDGEKDQDNQLAFKEPEIRAEYTTDFTTPDHLVALFPFLHHNLLNFFYLRKVFNFFWHR